MKRAINIWEHAKRSLKARGLTITGESDAVMSASEVNGGWICPECGKWPVVESNNGICRARCSNRYHPRTAWYTDSSRAIEEYKAGNFAKYEIINHM